MSTPEEASRKLAEIVESEIDDYVSSNWAPTEVDVELEVTTSVDAIVMSLLEVLREPEASINLASWRHQDGELRRITEEQARNCADTLGPTQVGDLVARVAREYIPKGVAMIRDYRSEHGVSSDSD